MYPGCASSVRIRCFCAVNAGSPRALSLLARQASTGRPCSCTCSRTMPRPRPRRSPRAPARPQHRPLRAPWPPAWPRARPPARPRARPLRPGRGCSRTRRRRRVRSRSRRRRKRLRARLTSKDLSPAAAAPRRRRRERACSRARPCACAACARALQPPIDFCSCGGVGKLRREGAEGRRHRSSSSLNASLRRQVSVGNQTVADRRFNVPQSLGSFHSSKAFLWTPRIHTVCRVSHSVGE